MSNYQKRLGNDNYDRPKLTLTDKLTADDIESKLEDYSEVTDIFKVPLGTHMRYFITTDKGDKKFRMGGILKNNNGLPKFVVLSNGQSSWSVQVEGTIFFKKMTIREIKQEYEDVIQELEKKVNSLTNLVNNYRNKLNKYKLESNTKS